MAFDAGLARQFNIGQDADADQRKIGGDFLAVIEKGRGDSVIIAFERRQSRTRANIDALGFVHGFVKLTNDRAGDARKDAFGHFKDGDLKSHLSRNSRRFKANITGADNYDLPAPDHLRPDALYVSQRAQIMNPLQVTAGDRTFSGARAGRNDELVVFGGAAVFEAHAPRLPID